MDKVKPVIVLAVIAAFISTLVIVVYNLTYVDTSNVVTDKQADALIAIYGGTKEDYEVIPAEKWEKTLSQLNTGTAAETIANNIEKVFRKKDGSIAIECVVKGYKKGFDIMVGVEEGSIADGDISSGKVAGVAIVSVGEETPGLGTKTNNPEWLANFKGISGKAEIVKTAPSSDNQGQVVTQVQAVTSATYSSKGVATAVNTALAAYSCFKDLGGEA